jgi:aspartyl-tRNA(Asn)/glutamyl-tRNA(Gln) amidotransferase subunit A
MSGTRRLSMTQAAQLTRAGEVSAVELVEQSLSSIHRSQDSLNAFVLVDDDGARQEARRLDQLDPAFRGALHGVPVAIKDIFDVAGHPTRRGSAAFENAPPARRDSEAVRRLRSAGAVVVGKTRTHALACGVYTGGAANPWDVRRSAGGSSGGSGAAVAAGLVFGATGSDTGGSVRIPAALCGAVGLKPTYGRISRVGVASLAWSLDHVGPLARDVADAWLMYEVMAGGDVRDPATVGHGVRDRPPAGGAGRLRVGIPGGALLEDLTPGVRSVWARATTQLSADDVDLVPVTVRGLSGALAAEFAIVMAEAATYYERLVRAHRELIEPGVRDLLEAGLQLPAVTYLRAQRARALLQRAFADVFRDEDCLGVGQPPPEHAARAGASREQWEDA